jgi:hypothetical protein
MLTLVIVPAVFTLFDDIERWVGPKATALLAGTQALAGVGAAELAADQPKLGPSAAGTEIRG